MDLLYRLGRILSFIFLPIFGQVQVIGRHHIPREGGFIIACNHQSIADPPLIVYSINRPVFFMAKKSLFKTRAISRMLRALHVYPVNRTGVDIEAIKWAQAILTKGHVLLIFPEGTRTPVGERKPYKYGITALYKGLNVPCLPVAINAGYFWSRRRFLRYPGKMVIEFLKPIPPGLEQEKFSKLLYDTIEDQSDVLLEEAKRDYP